VVSVQRGITTKGHQWGDEWQFERVNSRVGEIPGYSESESRGNLWKIILAALGLVGNIVESFLSADGSTYLINNVTKNGKMLTCAWHNRILTDADSGHQSF
jgi:hypothetical protein